MSGTAARISALVSVRQETIWRRELVSPPNHVRDDMREQLHAAIERLRKDLLRVEMWAAALDGFSRPVPDYQPDDRFLLPRRGGGEPRNPAFGGRESEGGKSVRRGLKVI
jgi:hypothetical protein